MSYTVTASNYDEAMERLDDQIDEVIDYMLENNSTNITVEYGECIPYSYKGCDDCEYQEIGEFDITAEDLDIDWFEVAKQYYDDSFYCLEQYRNLKKTFNNIKKEIECIIEK